MPTTKTSLKTKQQLSVSQTLLAAILLVSSGVVMGAFAGGIIFSMQKTTEERPAGIDIVEGAIYRLLGETEEVVVTPARQSHPQVFGNKAYWLDWRAGDGNADIYSRTLEEGAEEVIIEDDISADSHPKYSVYGNKMVWVGRNSGEIYSKAHVVDLVSGQEIAVVEEGGGGYVETADIHNKHLVYSAYDMSISKFVVYYYNLNTGQKKKLSPEGETGRYPKIFPPYITWTDHLSRSAYLYNMTTPEADAVKISGDIKVYNSEVNSNYVVFQGYDGDEANRNLYLYKIADGSLIELKHSYHGPGIGISYDLGRHVVVWDHQYSVGLERDITFYNIRANVYGVHHSPFAQAYVQTHGTRVVYTEYGQDTYGDIYSFSPNELVDTSGCVDTDGGLDYYTRGSASGPYGFSHDTGVIWQEEMGRCTAEWDDDLTYAIHDDCCSDRATTDQLNEAYCGEGGIMMSTSYHCPGGCANGACIGMLPDLVLKDIEIRPQYGWPYGLWVTVENDSDTAITHDFQMEIENVTTGDSYSHIVQATLIEPHVAKEMHIDWMDVPGTYHILATVDVDDVVEEISEDNNILMKEVVVPEEGVVSLSYSDAVSGVSTMISGSAQQDVFAFEVGALVQDVRLNDVRISLTQSVGITYQQFGTLTIHDEDGTIISDATFDHSGTALFNFRGVGGLLLPLGAERKTLIIRASVDDTVASGATFSFGINSGDDIMAVDEIGGFVVDVEGDLPFYGPTTYVVEHGEVASSIDPDTPSGLTSEGPDTLVLKFNLEARYEDSLISSLTVNKSGSLSSSAIQDVSLWVDGQPKTRVAWPGGDSVVLNLGAEGIDVQADQIEHAEIRMTIFGAVTNKSLKVDVVDMSAVGAASGYVIEVADVWGGTLYFDGVAYGEVTSSLHPGTPAGLIMEGHDKLVLKFNLEAKQEDALVTSLTVNKSGSLPSSAIQDVSLWVGGAPRTKAPWPSDGDSMVLNLGAAGIDVEVDQAEQVEIRMTIEGAITNKTLMVEVADMVAIGKSSGTVLPVPAVVSPTMYF